MRKDFSFSSLALSKTVLLENELINVPIERAWLGDYITFLVLLVQRQEEEKKEKERKLKEQQRLINTQARGQAKKKVNRFDSSFFYLLSCRSLSRLHTDFHEKKVCLVV